MRKPIIAFIALFVLLLGIAPSTAMVSFITLDAPSTVNAGASFEIAISAYDPDHSMTSIAIGDGNKFNSYTCQPAHTCTKTLVMSEASAGQKTYTVKATNDIGQASTETVSINVESAASTAVSTSSTKTLAPSVSPVSSSPIVAAAAAPVKFQWRTAAIDGPNLDNDDITTLLNPSSIKINNVGTKAGNPYAVFNVSANTRYDIFYSATGYSTDGDVFFFDSNLLNCPVSGCYYVNGQSATTCNYNATNDDYNCIIDNPNYGGPIAFDYYKNHPTYGADTIIVLNRLFKPHCPIVYGMKNITFVNGQNYTAYDLDNYIYDDNTAKSDILWTIRRENNTHAVIGSSNIVTFNAIDPLFSGNAYVRFTATDGTCSDSDDLLVIILPSSPDTVPPIIAITNPLNGTQVNSTPFIFSAVTNEIANCRYSTVQAFAFNAGTAFTTTGGISHSSQLNLTNGVYTYYVKCQDLSGNTNTDANQASTTFTVSIPVLPNCGNGAIESGEQCDDSNLINGDGCNAACRTEYCGDGIQQSLREQCDDGNLNNGDGCSALCTIENYPTPFCGNAVVETNESCDGANLNGQACTDLDGFTGGALSCTGHCTFNTTACTGGPNPIGICGDGAINHGESCDGANLGSETCIGLGFTGGTLACDSYCSFNTSACVESNVPPTVMINSPFNGQQFVYECEQILFNATVNDTDGTVDNIFWYYLGGMIDNQTIFTMNASQFNIGANNVSVTVVDNDNAPAYSSVMFNVQQHTNPTVNITLPLSNFNHNVYHAFPLNTNLTFSATAASTDACIPSFNYFWRLDGTPIFSNSQTFSISNISAGLHNMTVYATDNFGGEAYDSILLNITQMPNQAPTVMITLPNADPYQTMQYCPVFFNATATDVAPGYIMLLGNPSYNWQVSMANGTFQLLPVQQYFNYTNRLPIGQNTFTVIVSDNDGLQAFDTVIVNVTPNIPPSVNITLPVPFNNYTHTINRVAGVQPINFDAILVDGRQDDCAGCTANDYTWRWFDFYNGVSTQVASSSAFSMNAPALGIHILTVQSQDCYGATGQDVITVNVTNIPNSVPLVTIVDPDENDTFVNVCQDIFFNASAIDPDNDDITAWLWTYLGGQINNGQNYFTLAADNFAIGNNTVYAYATDNQTPAGVGSAAVSFNVVDHTGPAVALSARDGFSGAAIFNGSSVNESRQIIFNSSASRTDICNVSQFTYYWEDNGFYLANTQTFSVDNLSIGMHLIRVIVTDNYGYSGTDAMFINITDVPNLAPNITGLECYDLATGSLTLMEYRQIQCNATAVDPDLNNITMWLWDVDGDGFPQQISPTNGSYLLPALLGNGTYNVTLTIVDDGEPAQTATLTRQIVVHNNAPNVTLTSIPNPPVGSEPLFVNFTCSIANGIGNTPFTYNMSFGNGFTDVVPNGASNQTEFTVTYMQSGIYNATCFVVDMDGDIGAASLTVNVTDSVPVVDFNYTPINPIENQTVQFTDLTTAFDMPITWFWQFGDGSTSTQQNPSHAYLQNATYTVNLTVTDNDGTSRSHTEDIVVGDTGPTVFIIGPNQTVEGTNVTFAGFATAYDMPLNYSWNFGDGTPLATGTNIVGHVYAQNGNYTVTLTVTDADGTPGVATHNIIVIDTAPIAVAGPDQTVDECQIVFFNGSLSTAYDFPFSNIGWEFGDGANANTIEASHNYTQQGTYTAVLNVTDGDGTSRTDSLIVTVLDTEPEAFFEYAPINPVEGNSIAFDASGSILNACDGPNFNFTWNFGDGTIVSGINMDVYNHSYSNQGRYNVTLSIRDGDGDTDSYRLTLFVTDANPVITTLGYAPIPTNEGDIVNFSATATDIPQDMITNYLWNYGDGNTDSGAALTNPTHRYGDNGTYIVNLTVSDEDSSVSRTMIVNVNNVAPTVSAGPLDGYSCTVNTTTPILLVGSASDPAGIYDPLTYDWDFDYDNVTFLVNATGTNPAYLCPNVPGIYTIALRVRDGDGGEGINWTTMNATTVPTNNPPYFNPALGTAFAVNNTLFTYDVNATDPDNDTVTYYTDTPGIINLFNGTIQFTPTTVGVMTINVTACDNSVGFQNNCTSDDLVIIVTAAANQLPIAVAGGNYTGVEGSPVLFDGSGSYDNDGTVTSWQWNFGDSSTGTGQLINHTYADNGTYLVTLTVTDDLGGTNSTTVSAIISNAIPTISPGGPYFGNEGSTISLNGATATDPAGIYDTLTFRWDLNGDGFYNDSIGQIASFFAPDNGTYLVGINVSDEDGGWNTTTATVIVANLNATADADGPYFCNVSGSAILRGMGWDPAGSYDPLTNLSYSWDLDNDGVVYETIGQNVTYMCTSTGMHIVNLLVDDGDGGYGRDYAVVNVGAGVDNILPVVSLLSPGDNTTDADGLVTLRYNVSDNAASTMICDVYMNVTGVWQVVNSGQAVANGTTASFTYPAILPDALYRWNAQCTDGSNIGTALADFTFRVSTGGASDATPPVVTLVSPAAGATNTTSNIIDFVYTVNDSQSSIASCSLLINGIVNSTDFTITEAIDQVFTVSLGNGVYNWNVQCTDSSVNANLGQGTPRSLNISVPIPQTCGNSLIEGTEQCDDGNTINGDGCTGACRNEICGDGVQQPARGEQCDDGNYVPGDGCSPVCTLEFMPANCGNGILNTGESCDGANLNGLSCNNIDGFTGGTLSCTSTCSLNTTACTGGPNPFGICGDGLINHGEACDWSGQNLGPLSCSSFGFSGGALSCTQYCALNTSLCTAGDVTAPVISNILPANGSTVSAVPFTFSLNTNENAVCRYSNVQAFAFSAGVQFATTGGTSHSISLSLANGAYTYYIKCNDTAGNINNNTNQGMTSFTVNVVAPPNCGNGAIDAGEQCDDSNLINGDGCNSTCGLERCGDGILQAAREQCDDGNIASGDGCSFLCTIELQPPVNVTCGNGAINPGESCDGAALPLANCIGLDSFTGGSLACTSSCTLNTSSCTGPNPLGICGDGTINPGESCDGAAPWGTISTCANLGFTGGALSCDRYCHFNTSLCTVAGNPAPIAEAGQNRTLLLQGLPIALNGTGSYDPDAEPLSYNWTQSAGPGVVITGSNTATPSFTPAVSGNYTFRLIVNDSAAYSVADYVTITVYRLNESIMTQLAFFNATGNQISSAKPGDIVYAQLTINNMRNYSIFGVTSTLGASAFPIKGSSDGNNDTMIMSNIPAIGVTKVWWNLTAPSAGNYLVSVDTDSIISSQMLGVVN